MMEDGTEEVLIDKIIDEKVQGRGMRYRIRWVGYGPEHDEWLSGLKLKDNAALDVWERMKGRLVEEPAT